MYTVVVLNLYIMQRFCVPWEEDREDASRLAMCVRKVEVSYRFSGLTCLHSMRTKNAHVQEEKMGA